MWQVEKKRPLPLSHRNTGSTVALVGSILSVTSIELENNYCIHLRIAKFQIRPGNDEVELVLDPF